MVIITSMHYESTVIHNAGVSESNFLEKFAHAVADPAIMEVLKSMMLGSVTPAHHEEQYSHNHRVGDLSHEWCRPLFYKQSGSTSIIMSTTLLKSMHDTAHRLEIQDTVPNFRERERERERERDVTAVSWIFSTVKMQAMAYDAGVSEFMIILHRQGSKVCRALPVIM